MLSRVSPKDAPTSPHDTLRKTARILAGDIAQPSHCRKHSQEVPLITLRVGMLHRAACVLPVSITIRAGEMGRMVLSLVTVKQQLSLLFFKKSVPFLLLLLDFNVKTRPEY